MSKYTIMAPKDFFTLPAGVSKIADFVSDLKNNSTNTEVTKELIPTKNATTGNEILAINSGSNNINVPNGKPKNYTVLYIIGGSVLVAGIGYGIKKLIDYKRKKTEEKNKLS